MKTRLKKAYYAHSMKIYNSKREAEEYAYIKSIFKGNVVCPNKDLGELGSMKRYLNVVSDADAVYASEFNERVGKGVFEECETALKLGIPVYVVRKGVKGFYCFPVSGLKIENQGINWVFYGSLVVDTSFLLTYLKELEATPSKKVA
jgi:hypothetical protein